jgi:hypothetical protein
MTDKKRIKRIRNDVIDRDGLICCYCDKVLGLQEVTLDHIVPDSHRGTFNATNLTVSCGPCNHKRGNEPFFDYCRNFDFSNEKIGKYMKLYAVNLRIKVLNLAKESFLKEKEAIPNSLIEKSCKYLKISFIDFTNYFKKYNLDIDLNMKTPSKEIKYNFETLIKLLQVDIEF